MSGTSIAKLAHTNSDWIIDKEATATNSGSRHIECTVCHTVIKTEAILPQDSVTAFVTSITLIESSATFADRYTYTVMPISAYDELDASQKELVSAQYEKLSNLIEGYNTEAAEVNESHAEASVVILMITPEQISAFGYAILPSKKYV
jgi:hypothetical protein